MDRNKQIKHFLNMLLKDGNSVLYTSNTIILQHKRSTYPKYRTFLSFYKKVKAENSREMKNITKIVTELLYRTILLIRIKKHRSSAIYSFDVLLQLMHADIADIRLFPRSTDYAKYCLLIVDLFASKIYTHEMKNWSLLKKIELFLFRFESQKENL